MLGQLPQTLDVGGKAYRIRSDFRSILRIIAAFADDSLTGQEKVYVALKQIYRDFDQIPPEQYGEAYERAMWFINCGEQPTESHTPQIVDWLHDEQLIFPALLLWRTITYYGALLIGLGAVIYESAHSMRGNRKMAAARVKEKPAQEAGSAAPNKEPAEESGAPAREDPFPAQPEVSGSEVSE